MPGTGKPLTLETYHRFFLDPWDTRITIDQLNEILSIHGFVKLHHEKKRRIMECLVGQVDLLPPRRSTLRDAASPPSAAVLTTAQARNDVEALGWAECPIACVAAFAAPSVDAPEPVEPVPRPADSVLAGRRPRSKRTRGSAYGPGDVPASKAVKAAAPPQKAKVIVKVEERDRELVSPPPPPPLWMRSPTPPPPPSPPPPPPCWPQPTMAPIPAPLAWGTPTVLPQPSQLFWGLPLPTLPAAPPCHGMSPLPESAPGWIASVPPSYPAPFWGAPSALPPLPPHVLFCRPPTTAPHWGSMLSPTAHPLMQLQRPPLPVLLQKPPPHLQGRRRLRCFRHHHLSCSCSGHRQICWATSHLLRCLRHHQLPCSSAINRRTSVGSIHLLLSTTRPDTATYHAAAPAAVAFPWAADTSSASSNTITFNPLAAAGRRLKDRPGAYRCETKHVGRGLAIIRLFAGFVTTLQLLFSAPLITTGLKEFGHSNCQI